MTRSNPWRLGLGVACAAMASLACARARRRAEYPLQNRVVVITGGSRGLGLELAREAGAQGARLALIARSAEDLERAGAELRATGIRAITIACDVTEQPQIEAAIACVLQHFGRLDVLINNAGVIQAGPLDHMRVEDFERSFEVHVLGPLHATLAARPHLRRSRGRVVNISSIGGRIAPPHLLPYVTGKFGLVGLSEGMRAELRREGIIVTTICPGLMRTGSPPNAGFKGQAEKEYAWFSIASSVPGFSMCSRRAARRILSACREGRARVTLGAPARAAVLVDQIAPGFFAALTAFINAYLPAPAPEGRTARGALGRESESPWTRSLLTRPTYRAARKNNQMERVLPDHEEAREGL